MFSERFLSGCVKKETGGKVHMGRLVGGYWGRPSTRWRETTIFPLAHGDGSMMDRRGQSQETLGKRVEESK